MSKNTPNNTTLVNSNQNPIQEYVLTDDNENQGSPFFEIGENNQASEDEVGK